MAANFQVAMLARTRNFRVEKETPKTLWFPSFLLMIFLPEMRFKIRLTEFAALLPFEQ